MKKTISMLLLVAAVALVAGCSKNTQCRCQAIQEVDAQGRPLVTYFDVEPGASCSKITRVGFEQLLEGKLVRNVYAVKCEKSNENLK